MKKLTIMFIIVMVTIFSISCRKNSVNPNWGGGKIIKTSDLNLENIIIPALNHEKFSIVAGEAENLYAGDVDGVKKYLRPQVIRDIKRGIEDKINNDKDLKAYGLYVSKIMASDFYEGSTRFDIIVRLGTDKAYSFDYPNERNFYIDIGVRIVSNEADQDIFVETYAITKDDVNIKDIGKQSNIAPFEIINGGAATTTSITIAGADDHDVYVFAREYIDLVLDEALQQPENKVSAEKVDNYNITKYKEGSLSADGSEATFIATFEPQRLYEGDGVKVDITVKLTGGQQKFIAPDPLPKEVIDITIPSPNEHMTITDGADINYIIENTGTGNISISGYEKILRNIYNSVLKDETHPIYESVVYDSLLVVDSVTSDKRTATFLIYFAAKSPNYSGYQAVNISVKIKDAVAGESQDLWGNNNRKGSMRKLF